MPMQMKCPNPSCTTVLTVREDFAGKMIKCPTCAATLMVPAMASAGVASVPAAPAPTPAAVSTPLPPEVETPKASFMDTVWALCDKNGLDRKAQLALLAGIAAMLFLLFAMLLPRYTETITDLRDNKELKSTWFWWLGHMLGGLILFVTTLELGFLAASLVKMHMFLRYGFFAGLLWGAFLVLTLFVYFIINILSGGDSGGVRTEISNGIGTYFALLASLGIAGTFAFLSYPHIMKMIGKKSPA